MRKAIITFILIVVFIIAMFSVGAIIKAINNPNVTPTPTSTPIPAATATPLPPTPSPTPKPTATPSPPPSPTTTPTPTPTVIVTPTPIATETPIPTPSLTPTLAPTPNPITSPEKILCIGDSITFGVGVTVPYPDTLQQLTGMTTINAGQGGAETDNIAINYDNQKTQNYNILVIEGGVNDIRANVSEANIENNLNHIWHDALSRNMRVYVLTIMPFENSSDWTPDKQTELLDVNSWIKNNVPPEVTIIDTYAALEDSANSGCLQSMFDSGDHIHPSQLGANAIANLVAAAIQSLNSNGFSN